MRKAHSCEPEVVTSHEVCRRPGDQPEVLQGDPGNERSTEGQDQLFIYLCMTGKSQIHKGYLRLNLILALIV